MRITVALCTRNRAASLAAALGSMAAMRRPEGLDWRLIVVDNAVSHASEIKDFAELVERTPGYLTSLAPVGNGEWLILKELD